MNYFDFLVGAFAILAVIAVYQMRPCTLILAGNNMLVARALSGIERVGPPPSHWYLPVSLFAQENLATAATIMTIMLAAMVLVTFLFIRKRVRIGMDAPAIPKWLLAILGIYLAAYVGSMNTILTGGYASQGSVRYSFELGGGHAFLVSLALYELGRRRLLRALNARTAFAIAFAIAATTGYARGSTGYPTGFLVVAAILLLPHGGSSRRMRNLIRVSSVLLSIVALSFVIRGVRANLAWEGVGAINEFMDSTSDREASRGETGEGAETSTNAGQSAIQMLMCASLYDSGNSREWRSIYNVVEYTFMPSFFVTWFGWTRSLEPAWELSNHFIHGGGINVLGEFYWNGGYLCVVIMVAALVLFCTAVDLRYRASPFWLMMVVQFAPSFLMGYGYGFPQVARGAINGLLAVAAYKILVMVRGAPETSTQTHAAADNPAIP